MAVALAGGTGTTVAQPTEGGDRDAQLSDHLQNLEAALEEAMQEEQQLKRCVGRSQASAMQAVNSLSHDPHSETEQARAQLLASQSKCEMERERAAQAEMELEEARVQHTREMEAAARAVSDAKV